RIYQVLAGLSVCYPCLWGTFLRVTQPFATLSRCKHRHPVRLACVKPAANVHPEPGSNSCLKKSLSINHKGFLGDLVRTRSSLFVMNHDWSVRINCPITGAKLQLSMFCLIEGTRYGERAPSLKGLEV